VTRDFAHRGAAMQEARLVIDGNLAQNNNYNHRLMDYRFTEIAENDGDRSGEEAGPSREIRLCLD
jgi:hypothetical protein